MGKIDITRELDWLYRGSVKKPDFVDVPPFNFLVINGYGDPNRSRFFREAMYLIFNVSLAIKDSCRKMNRADGYFDYIIPPIEGLWFTEKGTFSWQRKNEWKWKIMIMQPEFITKKMVDEILSELSERRPDKSYSTIYFENFHEGLCVQMLHNDIYSKIPETLEKMKKLAVDKKLVPTGKIHEIFFTDPRKIPPDNYRTLLRLPVTSNRNQ